jgi:hypothetical protein
MIRGTRRLGIFSRHKVEVAVGSRRAEIGNGALINPMSVGAVMRLAARPFGAHSSSFTPFVARMRRMPLTIVVLPTPGQALPWVSGRIGLELAESQIAAIKLALVSKVDRQFFRVGRETHPAAIGPSSVLGSGTPLPDPNPPLIGRADRQAEPLAHHPGQESALCCARHEALWISV